MRKTLEPLQLEGARRLAANYHHLLADQPGLGKTLQAIAACELVGAKNVLVICPASVRTNWIYEIREWFGDQIDGLSYKVISYDGASGKPGKGAKAGAPYDVIILDESHFVKNVEAKRTAAVLGREGLARLGRYIWCLSGTPVLNRPVELFPILKTMHPVFKDMSYAAFTHRYCGAFYDGRKMNVRGASRIAELAQLLAPFVTRRTKAQFFPNRKAPLVSRLWIELSAGARAGIREVTEMGDESRARYQLGLAKVPHVLAVVRDLLERNEKVAVYAHHRDVIEVFAEAFKPDGVSVFHGDLSDAEKAAAIERFQGEGCRIFVGQQQAAGVGINGLQRVCSTVVIAEPGWTPGETEQIIDRFDRIGQADELVNAYLIYAKDTRDDYRLRVHDRKVAVVGRLVDGDVKTLIGDLA